MVFINMGLKAITVLAFTPSACHNWEIWSILSDSAGWTRRRVRPVEPVISATPIWTRAHPSSRGLG